MTSYSRYQLTTRHPDGSVAAMVGFTADSDEAATGRLADAVTGGVEGAVWDITALPAGPARLVAQINQL